MRTQMVERVRMRLQRRWRAVQEADDRALGRRLQVLAGFIRSDPTCSVCVARLEAEHAALNNWGRESEPGEDALQLAGEVEQAASAWFLLQHLEGRPLPHNALMSIQQIGVRDRAPPEDLVTYVLDTYLRPLFDYLDEQLDEQTDLLAELRRFAQWAEWFGQPRIKAVVDEEDRRRRDGEVTQRQVESRLKALMFEQMYMDGLPLERAPREVETPTGRADFLVLPELGLGGRPIAAEVKLFGRRHDASGLRAGLNQLVEYMRTFACDCGYLVVFNQEARGLRFDLEGAHDGVPHLMVGHELVYLVAVEATGNAGPASKRGAYNPVVIRTRDLVPVKGRRNRSIPSRRQRRAER